MSTKMTDTDWGNALEVFRASLPRRGAKGRDDRLFLEALHYFSVHNITWRALPERFGKWNSVYKRYARWCEKDIWNHMLDHFAEDPDLAYLIPDSTTVRAHPCAAGAPRENGGNRMRTWTEPWWLQHQDSHCCR